MFGEQRRDVFPAGVALSTILIPSELIEVWVRFVFPHELYLLGLPLLRCWVLDIERVRLRSIFEVLLHQSRDLLRLFDCMIKLSCCRVHWVLEAKLRLALLLYWFQFLVILVEDSVIVRGLPLCYRLKSLELLLWVVIAQEVLCAGEHSAIESLSLVIGVVFSLV